MIATQVGMGRGLFLFSPACCGAATRKLSLAIMAKKVIVGAAAPLFKCVQPCGLEAGVVCAPVSVMCLWFM